MAHIYGYTVWNDSVSIILRTSENEDISVRASLLTYKDTGSNLFFNCLENLLFILEVSEHEVELLREGDKVTGITFEINHYISERITIMFDPYVKLITEDSLETSPEGNLYEASRIARRLYRSKVAA